MKKIFPAIMAIAFVAVIVTAIIVENASVTDDQLKYQGFYAPQGEPVWVCNTMMCVSAEEKGSVGTSALTIGKVAVRNTVWWSDTTEENH